MKAKSLSAVKRFILMLLCVVLAAGIVPAQPAEAASAKKTAMKAYATFLQKHPSKDFGSSYYDASFSNSSLTYVNSFFLYDLEGDGVPELFTYTNVNFRWFIVRVYTYKNGKVTKYKFSDGSAAVFDNNASANGSYSFYICKKGHIHNDYRGGSVVSERVYKVSSKKLKTLYTYDSLMGTVTAKKGSTSITESKYNSYTKNCTAITLKTYNNTAASRKKLTKGTATVN